MAGSPVPREVLRRVCREKEEAEESYGPRELNHPESKDTSSPFSTFVYTGHRHPFLLRDVVPCQGCWLARVVCLAGQVGAACEPLTAPLIWQLCVMHNPYADPEKQPQVQEKQGI